MDLLKPIGIISSALLIVVLSVLSYRSKKFNLHKDAFSILAVHAETSLHYFFILMFLILLRIAYFTLLIWYFSLQADGVSMTLILISVFSLIITVVIPLNLNATIHNIGGMLMFFSVFTILFRFHFQLPIITNPTYDSIGKIIALLFLLIPVILFIKRRKVDALMEIIFIVIIFIWDLYIFPVLITG